MIPNVNLGGCSLMTRQLALFLWCDTWACSGDLMKSISMYSNVSLLKQMWNSWTFNPSTMGRFTAWQSNVYWTQLSNDEKPHHRGCWHKKAVLPKSICEWIQSSSHSPVECFSCFIIHCNIFHLNVQPNRDVQQKVLSSIHSQRNRFIWTYH